MMSDPNVNGVAENSVPEVEKKKKKAEKIDRSVFTDLEEAKKIVPQKKEFVLFAVPWKDGTYYTWAWDRKDAVFNVASYNGIAAEPVEGGKTNSLRVEITTARNILKSASPKARAAIFGALSEKARAELEKEFPVPEPGERRNKKEQVAAE